MNGTAQLISSTCRHPEIIEKYYQFLDLFQQEKDRFERTLKKEARCYPIIGRFLKIPGVGIVTATTFFTIIDDPHRFDHKQKLWSYKVYPIVWTVIS